VAIALPGGLRLLRVPPATRPGKCERPGAAHQGVGTARRRCIGSDACAGRPLSRVLRSPRAARAATTDGLWLAL